MHSQILMSKQEQSNMNLLDNLMRGISTAEKLVYKFCQDNIEEKKYGYYDEKNSSRWKSFPELKAECLILKEIIQSDIEDFIQQYHTNFKFPTNLTQSEILNDLKRFKEMAKSVFPQNPEIIKYYSDMIKLVQGNKVERYDEKKFLRDYPHIKNPNSKKGVNILANQMFSFGRNAERQMKENDEELMKNNGNFVYYAKVKVQPGRYGDYGNNIQDYYKKEGEFEEEEEDKNNPYH